MARTARKSFNYSGKRMKVIVIVTILLMLIALPVIWNQTSRYRVNAALSDATIPSDWVLVEKNEAGNAFCLDLCTVSTERYLTDIRENEAIDMFTQILESADFILTQADDDCVLPENVQGSWVPYCTVNGSRGEKLTMSIVLYPPDDSADGISNTAAIAVRHK